MRYDAPAQPCIATHSDGTALLSYTAQWQRRKLRSNGNARYREAKAMPRKGISKGYEYDMSMPTSLPQAIAMLEEKDKKIVSLMNSLEYHLLPAWVIAEESDRMDTIISRILQEGDEQTKATVLRIWKEETGEDLHT